MKLGPDIARIGALLGDPARANMLTALVGGQALTAGELAREAGITASTASSHLGKLTDDGLLVRVRQSRSVYYALASEDVAALLETLMGLATRTGHLRTRPGPREPALRRARVCYDHLAGELAVAMLDNLLARGVIEDRGGALSLGPDTGFLRDFGIEPDSLPRGRRPVCKACLDWSERRSHLAGSLGAAILTRIYDLGWARRTTGTRLVTFSAPGLAAFEAAFEPRGR
ncbi:MAG: winged helix-turn-helix transcriptional regulator [Phenylobacterium sp.]|uniref:ArsR/SmtB family transcription factor n=1 Tax=Phenylobacterium sp. TaxID=1871053 RepID=UPI001B43FFD0|nr:metalloregulator ArsR/SmtB family transcription factor [Phenylobacterium sp.]MBP7817486.1 winged helix-turn-helix transcriptional regulator [Phenylobacterium sp.]MBP9231893.1 winged helix-turn-helix transcriptional regulator [Phenylobacterium sp.]MBP9754548.1 winged helix-turn-helix transcriptional regulator [Phenylobacterium sp.]